MSSQFTESSLRRAAWALAAASLVACSANTNVGFDDPQDAEADAPGKSAAARDASASPKADSGGTPGTPDSGQPPIVKPEAGVDPVLDSGTCTPLIDDMEHQDGSILLSCNRRGYWYTYNDGTAGGAQTPVPNAPFLPETIPGGRGTSVHAAHTVGSGFTNWGSAMAFDLNSPGGGGSKSTYNAGAYSGIEFYAKVGSGPLDLRLKIANSDTDPSGGTCAPCSDHFGATVPVTTTWTKFTVSFAQLKQEGWGNRVLSFDKSHTISVQFQVPKGIAFDLWVDDISFVQ